MNNVKFTETMRFRAIYIAAFAVMLIGLLGVVVVPRAHAQAVQPSDVRFEAGKYVLKVTKSHLRPKALSTLFVRF